MKVFITGGEGYIARNLTRLFKNRGDEVYAPSKSELNLLIPSNITKHLLTFDLIIHAASSGVSPHSGEDMFSDIYIQNIQMYENLHVVLKKSGIPIIFIGSGAEYDRRRPIKDRTENDVFNEWPIDPYGLSKNIITRRALTDFNNSYVLRLFGCFNHDEKESRLIRATIKNIHAGLPPHITQDRIMDYFYMDDLFTIITHLVQHSGPRHINLVYEERTLLSDIVQKVQLYMGVNTDSIIDVGDVIGFEYCGAGDVLNEFCGNEKLKLIGLDEGIRRTVESLKI